jgi:hypothetical protein
MQLCSGFLIGYFSVRVLCSATCDNVFKTEVRGTEKSKAVQLFAWWSLRGEELLLLVFLNPDTESG